VKGGVGKSTLSTLAAMALAHENPTASVYLIDMDLTGTSLSDVLPLEAPRWEDGDIDLLNPPSQFWGRVESRGLVQYREVSPLDGPVGVPFLNDFLLFNTPNWDDAQDVPPASIAWKLEEGPDNLRVFPSSALPRDLERALPVIYDEEHAAFLEGRLEYLLASMTSATGEVFVVFDTPPTIPGLSRSVLNLALRLSHEPKTKLSKDGFMPAKLEQALVEWSAFLIATLDAQDIRAAERWLNLVTDETVVKLVVNRCGGDAQQERHLLLATLRDPSVRDRSSGAEDPAPIDRLNPFVANPIWIKEDTALQQIFRGEHAPPILGDLLKRLDGTQEET
jgi:hypothetical protein